MCPRQLCWAIEAWFAVGIVASSSQAQVPTPTVSYNAPQDMEIPAGFSGDPVAFFDDFSWRTFVALNWPAAEGSRREPDTTKELGADAANVVWGTWKTVPLRAFRDDPQVRDSVQPLMEAIEAD